MAVSAQCPHCFAKLKLKNPELVGRKVRCPSCEEPFRVEALADSPGPANRSQSAPPADEDDWLEDLGSYGDDSASAAAPPPVIGRKKKKKASEDPDAKPRRRRDEEEELSLTAHRLLMMVTGAVGGLIGMAIWGVVMYATEAEWGILAILVGALAGTGVRFGASRWDFGWWPALTAVSIAAIAIAGGKLIGMNLVLQSVAGEVQREAETFQAAFTVETMTHENMLISEIADTVAYEWEEQRGGELAWPEDYDDDWELDPENVSKMYPPDVWAEATKRWQALSDEEKQRRRDEQVQLVEEQAKAAEEFAAALEDADFSIGVSEARSLFSPFDLLWFALACGGAFQIAAGWEDD